MEIFLDVQRLISLNVNYFNFCTYICTKKTVRDSNQTNEEKVLEIRINSDIQPEDSSNIYNVTNEVVSKYLTTILKFQPALPELLKILNPYAIFILTDVLCR